MSFVYHFFLPLLWARVGCFVGSSLKDAENLLAADRTSGSMHGVLSRALSIIGISNWWILNTGLCMGEFRGVDVYVKILSPQIFDMKF